MKILSFEILYIFFNFQILKFFETWTLIFFGKSWPPTNGISTPYLWYFDPSTHGISTPLPMVFWPLYLWYTLNPLPMVFWPPYPWYMTPLPMVYRPPYPWYFDPPTHGILTPLSMVYRTPYPWYFAYLLIRNEKGQNTIQVGGSVFNKRGQYTMGVKIPYDIGIRDLCNVL